MNGFASHGLSEEAFGEKAGNFNALRTFDAFPKTKETYTRRTSGGGYATLFLTICSALLVLSELRTWWAGEETQQFSVEKGVSQTLQINLDTVVHMPCKDLNINVQDAAGDRILAASMLHRDPTNWDMWNSERLVRLLGQERGQQIGPVNVQMERETARRLEREQEDTHAGHVLGEVRRGHRKFPKTPKLKRGAAEDSCRIYGSLEGNKVQGDFHITARGHGYAEFGQHLDHQTFNFSHVISELSFGPLYPSLLNPLDNTVAGTEEHFFRFQYYLSIVPTIYTTSREPPRSIAAPSKGTAKGSTKDSTKDAKNRAANNPEFLNTRSALRTNQYAVTSQGDVVPDTTVPGIFFKYDFEPILLTIMAARTSTLSLLVRVVNVVSGVLVGGGWIYQLWGWSRDVLGSRAAEAARRRGQGGMLSGFKDESDAGD